MIREVYPRHTSAHGLWVHQDHLNLVQIGVEIHEDYDISRSFRRGSNSEA